MAPAVILGWRPGRGHCRPTCVHCRISVPNDKGAELVFNGRVKSVDPESKVGIALTATTGGKKTGGPSPRRRRSLALQDRYPRDAAVPGLLSWAVSNAASLPGSRAHSPGLFGEAKRPPTSVTTRWLLR